MPIRDQTLKAFPFLFDQFGFTFLGAAAAENEMVVIAQSGWMRLRFIQDRADFFLDIGSSKAPDKWLGLYDVLDEMKQRGLITEGYKHANRISGVRGVLRKNLPAIGEYLLSTNWGH